MNELLAQSLKFDPDGFLPSAPDWNEDMAQRIADMDGIGALNERQLILLRNLREHYLRWGAPPALPHICRVSGFEPECMSHLFPSPHEAWRIAGLPNPGDEAVSYL